MTRELRDGRQDGLEPLESLDVRAATGFADLLQRMSKTAFGGRSLGEAYEVMRLMAADPDCTIVVTLAGAMTVAKMGRVLCEMIDEGLAHIIISTGALMAHGLTEAIGGTHYKHDPTISDKKLYDWGYNRVYDTLEMEANLVRAQATMGEILKDIDWSKPTCSWKINEAIGKWLSDSGQMPSVLGSAYAKGVPVFVPAFTDSELGMDVSTYFMKLHALEHENDVDKFFSFEPNFNPYYDLHEYARRVLKTKRLGIFTIGGGVPRNWAQQVGPFAETINMRIGASLPVPRFHYAVRICPEPVHWGGLSGCTYTEGVSWGKFVSREEGGRHAEVHCDATIAWPILVKAILESRGK
jgi:deoxyhypusine synthase